MIQITVLGSGSKGNCCAVSIPGMVCLIDAGFSAREIERRAGLAGLDLNRLAGIIVTHEHNDHAQGAALLAKRYRVPILASQGTIAALRLAPQSAIPLTGLDPITLGPFSIESADTCHDAAEPVAVAISSQGGRIGYATDLGVAGAGVRWLFRDLNAIILESNYEEILLRTSGYPISVQDRIAGTGGHLSNGAAAELLSEIYQPQLQTVILAHLSQRCNTPTHALERAGMALDVVGYSGRLVVAEQNEILSNIGLELAPT